MTLPILSIPIEHEQDVVIARRRARQVAALLKFDAQDQTRIATAVSEIVRNAFTYGGGGRAEFLIEKERANPALSIRVSDRGPGIQDVDLVLSGSYQSKTGMGAGLIGARRLMDSLKIDSQPGTGTTVLLSKKLSPNAPPLSPKSIGAITQRLSEEPQDFFEEVRTQNQELLRGEGGGRRAKR
jgi:anti-sigma regulatory factor (Ser/Thr protein kinase)